MPHHLYGQTPVLRQVYTSVLSNSGSRSCKSQAGQQAGGLAELMRCVQHLHLHLQHHSSKEHLPGSPVSQITLPFHRCWSLLHTSWRNQTAPHKSLWAGHGALQQSSRRPLHHVSSQRRSSPGPIWKGLISPSDSAACLHLGRDAAYSARQNAQGDS